MPKLLMITTVPNTLRGFLLPFAQHFRALGWQVDGMAQGATQRPDCVDAFDHLFDVKWSRNPLNPANLMAAPRTIRETVAREGYDIVHVHTPVAAFVTRHALRKQQRAKVIYTAHGFHFHRGGKAHTNAGFKLLERLAGRWTDYLIVINHEDEQAAKQARILPEQRIRYFPGIGVDLAHYNPANVPAADIAAIRTELGIEATTPLFLCIAAFNPGKRHKDVVEAFHQLENTSAHLAFAGEGKLMDVVKQQATEAGVRDRTHFLGRRPDIPALIMASQATILASGREGLPRSVMESLCLAVPVLGADCRGTEDLLAHGGGILFPVGDSERLAAAMKQVIEQPEEAVALGQAGQAAMQTYSLAHVLELHEALYREAMNEGDSA